MSLGRFSVDVDDIARREENVECVRVNRVGENDGERTDSAVRWSGKRKHGQSETGDVTGKSLLEVYGREISGQSRMHTVLT